MTMTVARTLLLCSLVGLPAAAQEPAPETPPAKPSPRAEAPRPRTGTIPLRVQITIARWNGEKKVSSLPFTLSVNGGEREFTRLRMGTEVPVRTGPGDKEGTPASFQYRNVGTNLDCRAGVQEDGRYNLEVRAEQSSVPASERPTDLPFFRTFNTSFIVALRDGQTGTYVVATDPVTGESVKIDVGLTVVR